MTLLFIALAVAIVVAIGQVVLAVHAHLPPGVYTVLGVVAAAGLVGVAKLLAALGLQQPLSRREHD